MPIDASIPLGVRGPEIEPYQNVLAKKLQIQSAQQEQEMARLKMDEYRTGQEETRTLNQLYQTALKPDGTIDRNALYSGAASRGMGARIPALQKGFLEADEKAGKVNADKFKLAKERYDYMRSTMGALSQEPNLTKRLVEQAGQALVQQGILPPEMYQQAIGNMPEDPVELRKRLTEGMKAQMPPEKVFELFSPKPTKIDTGQQEFFRDTNPNSPTYGQNTAGAPVQKMQSPDNKASVGASLANAAAVRETANATRDAARISAGAKQDRDTELKLQDDYRAESKGWAETSTAMKKVMTAIETADRNPGSALSAGTGFMKLLDPNSVVRETELGMALNASGWFDRATNIANTLQNGRTMTAEQKKNLKSAAQDLFKEAQKAQLEVDGAYKKRAKDYGLDAGRIIVDRGQNGPAAAIPGMSDIDAELARRQGK